MTSTTANTANTFENIEHRVLASGSIAVVVDGKVAAIYSESEWLEYSARYAEDYDGNYYEYGRTCSICDGLGHGYPGGGPCPLEDTGWADRSDDEMRWMF